jgi:hypothetical protein
VTLSRDRRDELEKTVQARLRAMLKERLPQVRASLENTAQSGTERQASRARQMLSRLDDEFGPAESRGPQ